MPEFVMPDLDQAKTEDDLGRVAAALRDTLDGVAPGVNATDGRRFTRSLVAPYYAIRVTGALFHTQGGLDIDAAHYQPAHAHLNDVSHFARHLHARKQNSHKGSFAKQKCHCAQTQFSISATDCGDPP